MNKIKNKKLHGKDFRVIKQFAKKVQIFVPQISERIIKNYDSST